MKIPIVIAIVILLAAAGMGLRDQQRLASVREHHANLVKEAAALGITLDPKHPAGRVITTKHREREDKQVVAKAAAAKFIAFAKVIEQQKENPGPPDESTQERIVELMDLMMSLDAAELKILIAELRASTDIQDDTRQGLIAFSVMTLANDHPQTALALMMESKELFGEAHMRQAMATSALARWAKDDPLGALEWARKHAETHPEMITDDTKQGLITGAAAKDPKLALKLIGELKLEEPDAGVSAVASAAGTPGERSNSLEALRSYGASLADSEKNAEMIRDAISKLISDAAREGFAAATQWLDSGDFTADELAHAASRMSHSVKRDETGQWIDWLGQRLPDDKRARVVQDMIRNWSNSDYRAAGNWLAAAADGPVKQAAVRGYAETVARYDPETAAQWALTLPPGKERSATIKRVYDHWPQDDDASKAAAEEFARQHGIKK